MLLGKQNKIVVGLSKIPILLDEVKTVNLNVVLNNC